MADSVETNLDYFTSLPWTTCWVSNLFWAPPLDLPSFNTNPLKLERRRAENKKKKNQNPDISIPSSRKTFPTQHCTVQAWNNNNPPHPNIYYLKIPTFMVNRQILYKILETGWEGWAPLKWCQHGHLISMVRIMVDVSNQNNSKFYRGVWRWGKGREAGYQCEGGKLWQISNSIWILW